MDSQRAPTDELQRRLWALGLDEGERERILAVAQARMIGPLALGEFVIRMRSRSLAEMQLRARRQRRFEVWIARMGAFVRRSLERSPRDDRKRGVS